MKTKTAALLLCPAIMLSGQMLPVFAENTAAAEESGTYAIANGDSFGFGFTIMVIDKDGNQSYKGYRTGTGVVGQTVSGEVPSLKGYKFVSLGSDNEFGVKVSNGKYSFTAGVSDVSEGIDGSYHLNNNITLVYELDTASLKPGWNLLAGLTADKDYWYYCNDDLSFKTGLQTIDGKKFYLYADGHMAQSEAVTTEEGYFFFGSSGAQKFGWIRITYNNSDREDWQYADPDTGEMKVSGWVQDKGRWYHFERTWMEVSTWIEENGKEYYVTNSGAMATSRWIHSNKFVNGSYIECDCYVDASGELLKDTWIGIYHVDENGVWDATR